MNSIAIIIMVITIFLLIKTNNIQNESIKILIDRVNCIEQGRLFTGENFCK